MRSSGISSSLKNEKAECLEKMVCFLKGNLKNCEIDLDGEKQRLDEFYKIKASHTNVLKFLNISKTLNLKK